MQQVRRMVFISLFVALLFYSPLMEAAPMSTLTISSPAFQHNGRIPAKYTCDGADINPPLVIVNSSPGAKSLALIVDDPDAPRGTWVHWVVWNIGPDIKEITEHTVPSGASVGMNDFRKRSYGGPCPPSGIHRYFFKLYALDITLVLASSTTKADLERAMKGHILGQAELIGLYARK
jgi:Raf kinase inhibitor-like YbhB/YbcL family protein